MRYLIFQKSYKTSDGVEDFKYFANTNNEIVIVTNESAIAAWDRGSDLIELDTYFDVNEYQEWWDKNKKDH